MAFSRGLAQYMQFNGLVLTSSLASDVKLNTSSGEIDMSTIGNNWKAFEQGQAEATIAVSGVWDAGTATTGLDAVLFANTNAGGTKLWEYIGEGSAVNRILYKGNGFLTGYEVGGAVGDRVGFSASLRVSGSVTRTTTT